jgi:hypothetical protein
MSAWSKLVTPMASACSIQLTRCCGVRFHSFMRHMPATMRDRVGPPWLVTMDGQDRSVDGA